MKKRNKRAFTITEIVIVIAVIAILAAVLIPTFSNVIANANKSAALQTCSNAVKDYQSIVHQDNDTKNDDISGTVFVSNDFAYVYFNSSLHYIGELSDMFEVLIDGSTEGTKPTFYDDTAVAAATKLEFIATDKNDAQNTSTTAVTLSELAANATDGKLAENIYFYEVNINGTNYIGYFTCETDTQNNNALYRTQGATYSRLAGIVSSDNYTVNAKLAA